MKTIEELRKLDVKKLVEELELELQELFKAKFEVGNGQSKSSHLIVKHKKQVARIKTLLTEKAENLEKVA